MFRIWAFHCRTVIKNNSSISQFSSLRTQNYGSLHLFAQKSNISVKYNCFYHSGTVLRGKTKKLLPFETETKVLTDVMLFKNENGTFFRLVSAFGLAQLVFWIYLARFSFQSTKDVSRDVEAELVERHRERHPKTVMFWEWLNFGDDKYRYGITCAFSAVGYLVALGACLYTMRSIRYLLLLKGGEFVRIITYAPIGARRITVPLSYVSGQHALSSNKPYYAFKVKGYWFNFLVDMKGQLLEPKLFENTIGVARSFKKKL